MSEEQQARKVLTEEDFSVCVLDGPISSINQIEMSSLSQAFRAAAATTPPCKDVFLLMEAITSIHLDPTDRGSKWRPFAQWGENRSIVPSDLRGLQSEVLEKVLPGIQHPALRARVADVVWSNDLRKGAVARIAIDAYCECIEGLLSGVMVPAFDAPARDLMDAETPAHRALQIAFATSKRGNLPDRVKAVLAALYDRALKLGQHVAFEQVAQLCTDYGIVEPVRVAVDAEAIANTHPEGFPEVVRVVLDLAALNFKRTGDVAGEQRCSLAAARQLLRMADGCPQAGAKASWVMDALLRLRHIKGDEAQALEREQEEELRRLQRASLREMTPMAVNVLIPEERERILEVFSSLDFPNTLQKFALLEGSPKMEDLKARANEQAKKSPLSSLFGAKYIDNEGKTVASSAGGLKGEAAEDFYEQPIAREESLRRAMIVANCIEPIRLQIGEQFLIEERHFTPIVWQSRFVSEGQAPLFAAGFARFFQGDFPSAAHLLIPRLEPSLRHLLKAHGSDPTKRRDDATEEDRSLDAIISNHRAVLDQVLGAPIVDELDRVFNRQPGPTLRHDVAHGQLTIGECYSADVVYACWLLYRITCLFVMSRWDERIRPALEQQEPGR